MGRKREARKKTKTAAKSSSTDTFKGSKLTTKQAMRNRINKSSREKSAEKKAAHLEATKEHREMSRYERKHGRTRPTSAKAKNAKRDELKKNTKLRGMMAKRGVLARKYGR